MRNVIISNKLIGETPLECLERVRNEEKIGEKVPMTYAGRLDPMADGVLVILLGEECKNKEKYLGLDKEYEVEVLLGVETDTYDVLGMIRKVDIEKQKEIQVEKYVGKFNQEYPLYSSKTIKQARSGEEIEEIPTKNVEIYSIEKLGERIVKGNVIAEVSINKIDKVKEKTRGDFRQDEILEDWQYFAQEFGNASFKIIKIKVECSSGTYMRSLAERMGKEAGVGGIAYSIRRVRVGEFNL